MEGALYIKSQSSKIATAISIPSPAMISTVTQTTRIELFTGALNGSLESRGWLTTVCKEVVVCGLCPDQPSERLEQNEGNCLGLNK